MKTWKDIRTETINLGFEKIKAYDKNKQAYVDAYNWAQGLMASTIGGVLDRIGIGCTGEHQHIFDLEQLAQGYDEEYVALAQSGVMDRENNKIEGWTLLDNRYLMLPKGYTGHCVVNIMVMPAPITISSVDTTECQLPVKWANIMPYLMANRLFLDDDAAKAGYYWNLYTDMRDEILAKEKEPQLSVTGGIDIDGWCD